MSSKSKKVAMVASAPLSKPASRREDSTENLWEAQQKKSNYKHEKMTEIMRAKMIFSALRDQHNSKHSSMFKAFQGMGLDYGEDTSSDDSGTLKFQPFYEALQGLYFDRLVSKQEAHAVFDLVDKDNSGSINFNELQQAFDFATGALGMAVQPDETPTTEKVTEEVLIDSPHRGSPAQPSSITVHALKVLTDEEMIEKKRANKRLNELKYRILDKVCQKNARKSIREALRVAYRDADVNGDGNLSYDEFADWLGDTPHGLGLGFTTKDIRDMTLACDRDLDGGIDCMEFIDTIARRDRPDPRTFLNESREVEIKYMEKVAENEVTRMQSRVAERLVKTPPTQPKTNTGEISTRVWYAEDYDERVYSKPESQSTTSSPRLLSPLKSSSSSSSVLNNSGEVSMNTPNLSPVKTSRSLRSDRSRSGSSRNARSTSKVGAKKLSARGIASKNSRRRRISRKNADVSEDIQSKLKQFVYERTLNPGMVSRLNFEDFGKMLPLRKPEKGQDFKPVWASRLTFDRIGLGTGGVDLDSSMYATDRERLHAITSGANTNPADKFCTREKVEFEQSRNIVRRGKRDYLAQRKGQLRRRLHQRADNLESTNLSRIRAKTFQKMRYLESLNEVEEFHVRTSYNTKGMTKSPIAARNQAGSIMLFRPPSPRGRRVDNLQTGIGQRAAAIVDWSF